MDTKLENLWRGMQKIQREPFRFVIFQFDI
jgi:hypothetical protein